MASSRMELQGTERSPSVPSWIQTPWRRKTLKQMTHQLDGTKEALGRLVFVGAELGGKQVLVRVKLRSSFHKGSDWGPMFLNYRSLNQSPGWDSRRAGCQ